MLFTSPAARRDFGNGKTREFEACLVWVVAKNFWTLLSFIKAEKFFKFFVGRAGKQLPRLASNDVREAKELGKTKMTYIRGSIHEELAKKEKKSSNSSSAEESLKRSGKSNYRSSREESIQRLEKSTVPESGHSSFQTSANSSTKGDISAAAIKESKLGSSMPIGDVKERAT